MEALSTMWALAVLNDIPGFQPCDKAAMLDDNTIEDHRIFLEKFI